MAPSSKVADIVCCDFWNRQVVGNTDEVLAKIQKFRGSDSSES
jgi:hypothetical protein